MSELRAEPRRRISELMSSPPVFVPADASVAEAAAVLYRRDIGAVLVGTAEHLLGILSERDVVRVVAHGGDSNAVRVGEVMSSPPIRLDAADTLLDAVVQAVDIHVRHLPVVDGGVVVGVVSIRDLAAPLLLEALTPTV